MLNVLSKLMKEGDELSLTVSSLPNGATKLLIIPKLGAVDEGDDQSEAGKALFRLRVALAAPLVLTLTSDDPDAEMMDAVTRYSLGRNEARSVMDSLFAQLADAASAARSVKVSGKASQKVLPAPPKPVNTAAEGGDVEDEVDESEVPAVPASAAAPTAPDLFA